MQLHNLYNKNIKTSKIYFGEISVNCKFAINPQNMFHMKECEKKFIKIGEKIYDEQKPNECNDKFINAFNSALVEKNMNYMTVSC